jgi:hypothetical protein
LIDGLKRVKAGNAQEERSSSSSNVRMSQELLYCLENYGQMSVPYCRLFLLEQEAMIQFLKRGGQMLLGVLAESGTDDSIKEHLCEAVHFLFSDFGRRCHVEEGFD